MLPPIPNCSKYIDQFPEEGLNSKNKADKERQEDYAAEVTVFRALESLEENIVVLHSLDYTNRQLKLFKNDFSFDESKPNKIAGECDFVAVGENCVIIIEVSDVKREDGKTTDKKLKKTFNGKKKQGERTKDLVENMLKYIDSEDEEADPGPFIKWYCAFLSLSSDCEHIFTEEQRSNIIFSDSFDSFQEWWKENVTAKTAGVSVIKKKMSVLADLLLGLWNIDTQNQVNLPGKCSFGSNIMKVDSQLKNAQITYGFRKPEDPEYNNPDLVEADDVFQGMGIQFLSNEQDHVFQSTEKFLWVNGPAGSGKTMLILGKSIKTAKSEEGKVVIFKNMSEERSRKLYQNSLDDSGIKYKTIDTNIGGSFSYDIDIEEIAVDIARGTCLALELCDVALLEFCNEESHPIYHVTRKFGGLKLIEMIITSMVQMLKTKKIQGALSCFIDDEHCLLEDGLYDRMKSMEEFTHITSDTNNNCLICVFTDIAQSSNHMASENVPSLLPKIDHMMHTYGQLALSRNFRNTFDIGNLLATIRETIMFSPEQQSGHFIRGPKPVIHFIKLTKKQLKLKVCEVAKSEIEKIIDSKDAKLSDLGFIGNNKHTMYHLKRQLFRKTGELVSFSHIADIYSAEWPAIVFLMDLTNLNDQYHKITHQLYLAVSRARVYCSVVILCNSGALTTNLESMLEKLEKYATVKRYSEGVERLMKSERSESSDTDSSESSDRSEISLGESFRKHDWKQFISQGKVDLPDIDDQGTLSLHSAARDGNLGDVKRLISSGERLDTANKEGHTPLYYAVKQDNIDVVRCLIKSGADVNSKDSKWLSPLHHAVHQENLVVVQHLVKSGAKIDVKDAAGLTPICHALLQKKLDTARYLVASGADVNDTNADGHTPLYYATRLTGSDNLDFIRFLVESGADVNCREKTLGYVPLNNAIERGDIGCVKFLVDSGSNVHSKDMCGMTPLHHASKHRSIDIASYLLECGADLYTKDLRGLTPMHYAVELWSLDDVQFWFDSGADVNTRDINGLTLLHYAAKERNLHFVRFLVESGADINGRDLVEFTPLHFAAQKNSAEVVKYLVESGADVNGRDSGKFTPLHDAALNDNLEAVRYLVESGADVNSRNIEGLTPLHNAVQQENLDVVQYLVVNGADVNDIDERGLTPFHYAARLRNTSFVQYFVQIGANVNETDTIGCTPLHYAAKHNNLEFGRYLVESGADVTYRSCDGSTPLHYTTNVDVVRYLVECGADVNSRNIEGLTPIHEAARKGNLRMVQFLVSSGANLNKITERGLAPLHYAAQLKIASVVRFLVESGAEVNYRTVDGFTPLHYAVQQDTLDIVRFLVESGADVNNKDVEGLTPIHQAVIQENFDVVQYLLESGADVNTAEMGFAPLHSASNLGNMDLVRILVETGADVNKSTDKGLTPLHQAVRRNHLEVTRYLVYSGASINKRDEIGFSPLHYAVTRQDIEITRFLVESGAEVNSKTNKGFTPLHFNTFNTTIIQII